MMSSFWILCVGALTAAVFLSTECQSAKLKPASAYFKLCRRKDPNLDDCVKNSINDLRPQLIKGIPELRLVPLEPMSITQLTLSEGQGNFRFAQTLRDLKIHGLGKFVATAAKVFLNDTDLNVRISMKVPYLRMDALYEMDGQILVIPIRGKGACVFHFSDVTTTCTAFGSIVTRAGKEYVDVNDVKWNIDVGGANSTFSNLFNGDKTLGDATNNFLNANWKDAFETYKHLPEEAFGQVFKDLTNQVFKRYPLNELYLD